ncbi:hypothetical protein ERX27_07565 [Macrococcus brunensis]|uniref:Uncharacterized protein n=1 Tax=Macrococcus brunensis TaxID=198483 RepID=A0A4R6BD00_9STAP|nr:hypothetical protein [Macrococcus brunensis]TDL96704.1 hypothetical protein ERX27_07565 [Macrococcus brunensis]
MNKVQKGEVFLNVINEQVFKVTRIYRDKRKPYADMQEVSNSKNSLPMPLTELKDTEKWIKLNDEEWINEYERQQIHSEDAKRSTNHVVPGLEVDMGISPDNNKPAKGLLHYIPSELSKPCIEQISSVFKKLAGRFKR